MSSNNFIQDERSVNQEETVFIRKSNIFKRGDVDISKTNFILVKTNFIFVLFARDEKVHER